MSRRSRRRPIAARLTVVATAASAGALLLVLAGLYLAVTLQLDASVDAGLSARSGLLAPLATERGPAALAEEPLTQLYVDDRLARSSPGLRGRRLLREGVSLRPGQVRVYSVTLHGQDSAADAPFRVLARGLDSGSVLVVAASVGAQIEAGERLLTGLAFAGPLVLLLVALVVYRAVRSALHPVDVLTREAAQIDEAHDAGRRLSAVAGDDEISRLATTLDSMLRRLGDALARERSFVDDASHELRTPLAVLRGELELALSDLNDVAAVEVSLQAALGETERLSRLADDLLVLARQRAGGLTLQAAMVDVHALLAQTGRRLGAGIRVDVEVDDLGLVWPLDRARTEQVLSNLLVNATAAGASRVVLAGALTPEGQELLLSVEDDGPGFPEGFADHAFERFSRADAARTRGSGAGLGLALVEAIVEAGEGRVRAGNDSRLGGAAVRVRLPRPAGHPVPAVTGG